VTGNIDALDVDTGHVACRQNDIVQVTFFLDQGANENLPSKSGCSALIFVVLSKQPNFELVCLLVNRGADIFHRDGIAMSAFDHVDDNNLETARFLLDCGIHINQVRKNLTALHWALLKRYSNKACLLLDCGASVDIQRFCGYSELHRASSIAFHSQQLISL
jgi:ankyrin repeat protein